jgi:hypothetical protein
MELPGSRRPTNPDLGEATTIRSTILELDALDPEAEKITQIASELGFTRGELGSIHTLLPNDG